MASQDLFADFDQVFQTLTPWIRRQGFEGGQRRTGFHMAIDDEHTLLVGFKRNKWNRRDRDHFDFLLEAYIKDETSEYLTWYWKSSTDAGPAMGRSSAQWERLDSSSEIDATVSYLKAAVEDHLLPAAKHEIDNPTSSSIGGTRISSPSERSE